ncbi:hypothetical protein SAMN02746065_1612 [Desulfocicer vacuolatum DSM 3385]|uniref:Uncharacterized protein n=1 Tax=Desulfocicer vacuolatum DSM 3385 TaxID=1121400 RepID=A0A1W2EZ74_9BACT|nr:hypothetical protein [Desulfocicer vacuolatum]SMD14954.1 hypothetical protein SAMN02746065_1612 [Desulfocicer vacuolatum DSM 3385]
METIYLSDLELPAYFVQLCQEYSVMTLLQALELIQRLLEKPELLPEDVTLEMINSLLTELNSHLSQEALDLLQEPVPSYPLDGLILEQPPEQEMNGEQSLKEFLERNVEPTADPQKDNPEDQT